MPFEYDETVIGSDSLNAGRIKWNANLDKLRTFLNELEENVSDVPEMSGAILELQGSVSALDSGKANTSHTHSLASLTDVDVAPENGEVLTYDGDKWVAEPPSGGTGAAIDVTYSNTTSELESTNVQEAIDELVEEIEELSVAAGVTNPMVSDLDANEYMISDASFRGFRDVFYDLSEDSESLIDSGTLVLQPEINTYFYSGLDSSLEIELPEVSSAMIAPFGLVSVSLAEGGEVSIAGNYVWGKTSLEDEDPSIPDSETDTFTIHYRWEPLIEKYVLHLVVLPPVVGSGWAGYVSIVGSGASSLNVNTNKDVHEYTYEYESVTQDGSVYTYVFFMTDAISSKPFDEGTYDGQLTPIASTNISNNAIWAGIYKPSQGDLNGGTLDLEFNYANEGAQIVVVEVSGANTTTPTSFNDVATVSNGTSIGPLAITSGGAGTLLLSACMVDEGRTVTVSNANSFSSIVLRGTGSAVGGFSVDSRLADNSGSYNSPTYAGDPSDRMNLLVVAVAPEPE